MMYRNYYPYPPVYMYYPNHYAVRRCMHHYQHIYQNQQPNPFHPYSMNGQQNPYHLQGQHIAQPNPNNFQGQKMAQTNPENSQDQQVSPLNQSYSQNESMPVNQSNINSSNLSDVSLNMEDSNQVAFTHQFLNEHGQVDVNKMLSTVGQLAQTVQQVSPVIKQVNDIIQSFRA